MSHVSSVNATVPSSQNYVKQNNPVRYQGGGIEGTEERTEKTDNVAEERVEISNAKQTVPTTKVLNASKGGNIDIKI